MWRDLERGHFCLSSTCVFIWRHHWRIPGMKNLFTWPEGPLCGVDSNGEIQNNGSMHLRICDCWVLSPQWKQLYQYSPPRLREHLGRGGGKDVRAGGGGGELGDAVFRAWLGCCTHELTAAVGTCTGSSQQDQSISQQAALSGLSGLLANKEWTWRREEDTLGRLRVGGRSYG